MIKQTKTFSLVIAVAILSLMLGACSDSDNLIFDEDNTSPISVNVYMAKSFDSTAVRVKSDTIIRGDSMLFIANILPSKSIRIRDSYWLLDNKYYASEFNIHDAIPSSGPHEIVFILVTYFGDTLSDTLHLWISSPPILDNKKFIPANESQNIPPRNDIQFAWSANDIDSIGPLHYHFILANLLDEEKGEPSLVDTIVNTPFFKMNHELKPLSQYHWIVQAYNEYNVPSKAIISSTFTTSGIGDESAISGILKMSSENMYTDIELIVLDTANNPTNIKQSLEKTPTTGMFEIKPLPPRAYIITAQCKKDIDFVPDSIFVRTYAGQISNIGTLHMTDKTPPTIRTISGSDTLDFADSLQFIITDGSSESILTNVVAYIGDRKITRYFSEGKTLTIPTAENDRSWIPQFVTIIATDGSGNVATKSFVLRPSVFWFETNNDTTISRQSPITLFITDHNPYSLVPTQYKISPNGDTKGTITIPAEGQNSIEYVTDGDAFFNSEQKVVMTVVYANGIRQSRSWTMKINEPPFMSFTNNCYSPCQSYIGPTAIFKWYDAEDAEKDSILYRLNIVYGSDTISDTTKFFYRSKFIRGNQTMLKDLPEGELYWWVEAMDPYGGVSPVWEPKANVLVLPDSLYKELSELMPTADSTQGGNNE